MLERIALSLAQVLPACPLADLCVSVYVSVFSVVGHHFVWAAAGAS